jgi:molybdate transport system substrate-binding protein
VRRAAALLLAAALLAGCGGDESGAQTGGGDALAVAAASDLRPAFTELGERFERRTGARVTFSFGSSGQLAQQLVNGAPFDLFASASVGYVDDVLAAGRGDAATKQTYAFGRLVVWSRDRELALADLADPALRTVAIANPEHAPYGRAAREALQRAGAWEAVEPKLVLGENISDTLRLARSGNADAAVVALSLALAAVDGRHTPIPERLHDRIEQALVVAAEGERADLARRFAAFVAGDEARPVMRRYGFALPGE